MVVVLSEKDRREIFDTLTDEQMRVVKKYVLYKARSRLLSRYFWKGINWELVRLEYDPLFKKKRSKRKYNPTLYCDACHNPLKYQYVVRSLQTGYEQELGETCFTQRTGIPTHIAREIYKSKDDINLFQDEILNKYRKGGRFPKSIYKKSLYFSADEYWGEALRDRILEFKRADLPLFHTDRLKLESYLASARREFELEKKEKDINPVKIKGKYLPLDHYLKEIVSKKKDLWSDERIKIKEDIRKLDFTANNSIKKDFSRIPKSKQDKLKIEYINPFNHKLKMLYKKVDVDIAEILEEARSISTIIMNEADDFEEDNHNKIAECKKVIQEVNELTSDDKIYEINLNNDIDRELNFFKSYLEELKIEKNYPYKLRNSLEKDEILCNHDVIDLTLIKDNLGKYTIDSQDEFLIDYYLKKRGYSQRLEVENISLEDFEKKSIGEQREILVYGTLKVEFAKIIYKFEQEVVERKEKVNELVEQIEVMAKQFFSSSKYISNREKYNQNEIFYHDEDYSKIIGELTEKKKELENFKNELAKYPIELLSSLHLVSRRPKSLPISASKIIKSYSKQLEKYQINLSLVKKYELLIKYFFEKYKKYHRGIENYIFSDFMYVPSKSGFKKLDKENQKNKLTNINLLITLIKVIRKYILKYEVAEKIKILNTLKRETEGENFVEYIRRSDKELGDIEKYCADLDKNINNKKYLRDIKKLAVEIPEMQRSFFGEDAEVIDTDKYLAAADRLKYNPRKKAATELSNLKKKLDTGIKRTNYVWKKPEYAALSKELDKIIDKDISIENGDGVEIFKQIKAQSDEITSLLTKEEKQLVEYFLRKHKFEDINGKYIQNIHSNITIEKIKNSPNKKIFLEYSFLQLKLEKYIYYYNKLESNSAYIRELEKIISMNGKIVKTKIKKSSGDPEELSTLLKDNLNIFRSTNNNKSQEYALIFSDYNNKIMKILHLSKKQGNNLEFIKESIEYLMDKYQSKKYLVKSNAKSKKSKYLDTYQDELDIKWKKDLIESMFKVEDEINWDKVKYKIVNYLSDYRIQINDEWKQELINLLFEINYNYFGNSLSDLSKENEAALINRNMLFLGFMNNTIKQLSKM